MKKIIDGKLYDTTTAEKIACCYEELPTAPNFLQETLYRKKTGEFFLHGEGGPSLWSGFDKIIPLSYETAQKWAQEKIDSEKYKEIFGPIEEDGSKKTVTLYMQKNIIERAKRAAQKKDMPLSAFFEMAIGDFLLNC